MVAWSDEFEGDVTAQQAYELLGREPDAQVVDVRTRAEWAFVGVPDLTAFGKEAILAEWQRYPAMEVVADFKIQLERELLARGTGREDPVLFLCRSGARSHAAAVLMQAAGWLGSRNITGGFEGPLNPERHRGAVDGWKVSGLPWIQT